MMKLEQDIDLNVSPDVRVHCSICLDMVDKYSAKSIAKLQCGHEFHLDCIGSAFNIKGVMQCPNCRNIEKGQWLYAIGSTNTPSDFNMDSLIIEQYPFFLVPYGFRVCPFRGLMETNDVSNTNHGFYGENMPPSPPSLAYFTYLRAHPNAPLNPNGHMDAPNMPTFDDSYRQNEVFASPSMDMQHPTWSQNLRINGGEPDIATTSRSPSQYVSSTQSVQTGSSSSTTGALSRHPNRVDIPFPFPSNVRRSNGSRGFPAFMPSGRPYDQRSWFYYPPYLSTLTETPTPNYFPPVLPYIREASRWPRHH